MSVDLTNANGKRRNRITTAATVEAVESVLPGLDASRVRIYGDGDGAEFLPNSYQYSAPMTAVEWVRNDEGWTSRVFVVDAKRSNGRGPAVSVDGRRMHRGYPTLQAFVDDVKVGE